MTELDDMRKGYEEIDKGKPPVVIDNRFVELHGVKIDTTLIKTSRRVTPLQASLCLAYARYDNVSEASRQVGLKNRGGYAWRILQKPHVVEYYNQLLALAREGSKLKASDILEDLKSLKDQAVEAGKLDTAVRCVELMGKHLGMFSENFRIQAEVKQAIVMLPLKNAESIEKISVDESKHTHN